MHLWFPFRPISLSSLAFFIFRSKVRSKFLEQNIFHLLAHYLGSVNLQTSISIWLRIIIRAPRIWVNPAFEAFGVCLLWLDEWISITIALNYRYCKFTVDCAEGKNNDWKWLIFDAISIRQYFGDLQLVTHWRRQLRSTGARYVAELGELQEI